VPRDRTSVLVIRAWATAQEPGRVRARITRVPDVATRDPVETVARSEEEVVRDVRAWLQALSVGVER
jgi:hypothetical protein